MTEQTREIRLRHTAEQKGLSLHKSPALDPLAIDYGLFHVADENNRILAGGHLFGYSMNEDEVEIYLANAQDFEVYFEDPHGDFWATDKPMLRWTRNLWEVSTIEDDPFDYILHSDRNDLESAAIDARAALLMREDQGIE